MNLSTLAQAFTELIKIRLYVGPIKYAKTWFQFASSSQNVPFHFLFYYYYSAFISSLQIGYSKGIF